MRDFYRLVKRHQANMLNWLKRKAEQKSDILLLETYRRVLVSLTFI